MTKLPRPASFPIWFAICALLTPVEALACSCFGITGIGTALTRAETVVVGRVERRLDRPDDLDHPDHPEMEILPYPAPIVVKVILVLKGEVAKEMRISTDFMCFRSFNLEDMKPGETFVFPISGTSKSVVGFLPSCSHSALKLLDGELYTNEFIAGGGRRLDHYMSLALLRFLLPLGVLSTTVQVLIAAGLTLVIPMLITRRIRRRSADPVAGNRPPDPIDTLRSLTLRSVLAVVWLLICSGFSIFFVALDRQVWWMWVPGTVFAFTAAGVALHWRWSEGLTYGLALLWIGACAFATYAIVHDMRLGYAPTESGRLPIVMGAVLLSVGAMAWCADAVRR
ncbi:MAG TPA: hypothetical protein VFS23_40730, partial [Vicinamibacterales bacterium]|nr:hypothetical protein [Vicinamibacterales bacterium]